MNQYDNPTQDPPVDSAGGSVAPKNPIIPGIVQQGQYITAPTTGAAPTQTENVQTTIPYWAAPYTASILQRGFGMSFDPYEAYKGQMYAGINPMQNQAYNNLFQMTPSAYTDQAAGLSGLAAAGGLSAGQNYANMATDPNSVSAYMSPYVKNVIEQQKQSAVRDYARSIPGMGANAARVGGLGGTRNALVQAEAQRNLGNQLTGIEAQGLQSAYDQAQKSQQFGANLGLQGIQAAGQAANIMGGIGQQQYQQGMDINKAQQLAGADLRSIEQQPLSALYNQYLEEKNQPYKQLSYFSDLLRGMPLSGSSSKSIYEAPPNSLNQLAGLGAALYASSMK